MHMRGGGGAFLGPVFAVALLTAAPALALKSDREQTVFMEAADVDVDFRTGTRTLRQNVVITQGTTQIFADKVVAEFVDGELGEATAWGDPAVFETLPDGEEQLVIATGDRLHLDNVHRIVTVEGDAAIDQNGNVVSGGSITYHLDTEVLKVRRAAEAAGESSAAAAGAAPRIVIRPDADSGSGVAAADTAAQETPADAEAAEPTPAEAASAAPALAVAGEAVSHTPPLDAAGTPAIALAGAGPGTAVPASVEEGTPAEAAGMPRTTSAEVLPTDAPSSTAQAALVTPGDGAAAAEPMATRTTAAKAGAGEAPAALGAAARLAPHDPAAAARPPASTSAKMAVGESVAAVTPSGTESGGAAGAEIGAQTSAAQTVSTAEPAAAGRFPAGAARAETAGRDETAREMPTTANSAQEAIQVAGAAPAAMAAGPLRVPPSDPGTYGYAPSSAPVIGASADDPIRASDPAPEVAAGPGEQTPSGEPAAADATAGSAGETKDPVAEVRDAAPVEAPAAAAVGVERPIALTGTAPGQGEQPPAHGAVGRGAVALTTAVKPVQAAPAPQGMSGTWSASPPPREPASPHRARSGDADLVAGDTTGKPIEAPTTAGQASPALVGLVPPAPATAVGGETASAPAPAAAESTVVEVPEQQGGGIAAPTAAASKGGPAADEAVDATRAQAASVAAAASVPATAAAPDPADAPALIRTPAAGRPPPSEHPHVAPHAALSGSPPELADSQERMAEPPGDAARAAFVEGDAQAAMPSAGVEGGTPPLPAPGGAGGDDRGTETLTAAIVAEETVAPPPEVSTDEAPAPEPTQAGPPAAKPESSAVPEAPAVTGEARRDEPEPAADMTAAREPPAGVARSAAEEGAPAAPAAPESAGARGDEEPGHEARAEAPVGIGGPDAAEQAVKAAPSTPGRAEDVMGRAVPARPSAGTAEAGGAGDVPVQAARAAPAPAARSRQTQVREGVREAIAAFVVFYETYFELGDADRLVNLFAAEGVQNEARGTAAIRDAYERLFAGTRWRRALVDVFEVERSRDGRLRARGIVSVTHEFPDGRLVEEEGPVALTLVEAGGAFRIARLAADTASLGISPGDSMNPVGAAPPSRGRQADAREAVTAFVVFYETYYELGDTDRLMGLFAADAVHNEARGASAIRDAYEQLFAGTRSRQAWIEVAEAGRSADGRLRARGTLSVTQEDADGRRFEEELPVELSLVEAAGTLRIAGLRY